MRTGVPDRLYVALCLYTRMDFIFAPTYDHNQPLGLQFDPEKLHFLT